LAPSNCTRWRANRCIFVGYQGMSMIAVAGLDMAAWDALPRRPACRSASFGRFCGPGNGYNSNGVWLKEPQAVAAEAIELRDEGGFTALKLRLGRDRLRDDMAAHRTRPQTRSATKHLMVDFNQGLDLGEALQRCHAIDDLGSRLDRGASVYDNFDGLCAARSRN
jgi:mandelate racemase